MVLRNTPSQFLFLAMPRTAQICNSTSNIQVRHPPALKQSWYGKLALRCHCLVLHHGSQVSYVLCLPQHTELGIWIPSISIKHRSSISSCVVWVSLFTSYWPWGNSTKGSCTTAEKVLVPGSYTHQWLGTLKHIVRANPGDSTVLSLSQGSSFLSAGRFWQKKKKKEEKLREGKFTKVIAPFWVMPRGKTSVFSMPLECSFSGLLLEETRGSPSVPRYLWQANLQWVVPQH